ncbi:hypothetical protein [Catenovulum sediminis]|uniref:hypothetical protein n=1 Tax=Catenovulum sediminis TaxID=1740262 RepID=UPI00117F6FB5|nr:hypothetical protein [Catenovulum sediminis]
MKAVLVLVSLITAILTSGCSVTPYPAQTEVQNREDFLYLRGNFTWWDIEEHAKVKQVEGQLYKATVELIADGQPYEFKFADENWSLGANCGYYEKADQLVTLDAKVSANCNAKFEPFRFIPQVTGDYDFFIDFTDESEPKVWIKPAEADLIERLVPSF